MTKYERQRMREKERGVIKKSYALDVEIVEEFKCACKAAGKPQNRVLMQLMDAYISCDKYIEHISFSD